MPNLTGLKFGGRQKGTPNKSTAEIRTLARQYGPEAIATLVRLMRQRDDLKVRLAAAKELLDRAYGRGTEVVKGFNTDAVVERMKRLEERKRLERQEARAVVRPNGELRLGNKV
jgi:hypothetical protein